MLTTFQISQSATVVLTTLLGPLKENVSVKHLIVAAYTHIILQEQQGLINLLILSFPETSTAATIS